MAAALREATTRIASGFAATSFGAGPVTPLPARAKRPVDTRFMPAFSASGTMAFKSLRRDDRCARIPHPTAG